MTAASVPEPESPCIDDTSSSERATNTSSPSASSSETETGYDTQTEATQAANASDSGDEPSQSRRCSEERDDVAADDTKRVALCELTGWL